MTDTLKIRFREIWLMMVQIICYIGFEFETRLHISCHVRSAWGNTYEVVKKS